MTHAPESTPMQLTVEQYYLLRAELDKSLPDAGRGPHCPMCARRVATFYQTNTPAPPHVLADPCGHRFTLPDGEAI
ncbi:hypothetical protein POF50_007560 [Streptomyces sp. SL13]|uniref:Uncharacterized protein n=1 Tax=Streptantibioticus silvisoli TaxID=2705255 RepID=A0AA90GZ68_9ACTN|nr:hypothetical protein [Streptantibioticus silvisoli]MDI5962570.1 hypothetical protein [Streptantibioticus silvisoli]MDI5969201.1 hypothetical protein [Streptantibioticus silvisoli]